MYLNFFKIALLSCCFYGLQARVVVLNKKRVITHLKQDEKVYFKLQQRYEEKFNEIQRKAQQAKKQEEILLQDEKKDQKSEYEIQQQYVKLQEEKQELVVALQQLNDNIQQLCQQELEKFDRQVIEKFVQRKDWTIVLPQYDMGMVIWANNAVDVSPEIIKAYEAYRKKNFTARAKIHELFDLLSVTYLEKIKVTYDPILKLDARHSIFYLENQEQLDAASRLYAESVEHCKVGPIELRWVNDHVGYGVYATKTIQPGDYVGEYTGLVRLTKKGERSSSAYAWRYPIEPTKNGIDVGDNLSRHLWLDAKYEGNEMRFVNHSDTPNVKVVHVIDSKGLLHVCYIAIAEIAKGQQVLVDYGQGYWGSTSGRKKVALS